MRMIFIVVGLLTSLATLRAGTLVQFRTVFGDVAVELYDREKPITTSNFLFYINSGRFQNTFFHRAVPGFVFQGGGFTVTNLGSSDVQILDVVAQPPITNEFFTGPFLSNTAGTIAMAKNSDPNSATSQFFFNLVDNSASLNDTNNSGGFTVFGRAVSGTNVLAQLNAFDGTGAAFTNLVVDLNPALVGNENGPFGELPLLRLNTNYVVINTNYPAVGTNLTPQLLFDPTNFVYVDITTLSVRVRSLGDSAREISWRSVPKATNAVEFTTQFPPHWQSLTNLVPLMPGTNAVVDGSTDAHRFYRVRVAF